MAILLLYCIVIFLYNNIIRFYIFVLMTFIVCFNYNQLYTLYK